MRFFTAAVVGLLVALPSFARADAAPLALREPLGDKAMRSPALLTTGIALSIVGSVAIPIGVLVLAIKQPALGCSSICGGSQDTTARDLTGASFVAGGAAAIIASIPMMMIGARHVPVTLAPSGPLGSAGFTVVARF